MRICGLSIVLSLFVLAACTPAKESHSTDCASAWALPANEQEAPSSAAYEASMRKMHEGMMIDYTGDADVDFARGMIPHHQGAIDMAEVELRYGHDPKLRALAKRIVAAQKKEIAFMQDWLRTHPQ